MKRAFILCALIITFVLAFCEQVTLIDQTTLDGQIVGKHGDKLFLTVGTETYSLNKADIDKVTNGGSTIKNLIFNKKDWGVDSGTAYQVKTMTVDSNEPVVRPDEKARDIKDVKLDIYREIGQKPIDQMTEREYQLYLAQIQAKALKENADKISGTMWGVFSAGLVLMLVGVLVSAGASK